MIGLKRKSDTRVRYSPTKEREALSSSPFTKQSDRGVPKAPGARPCEVPARAAHGKPPCTQYRRRNSGWVNGFGKFLCDFPFRLPINYQSLLRQAQLAFQLHDSPLPSSESPSRGSKDLSSPLRNRTE